MIGRETSVSPAVRRLLFVFRLDVLRVPGRLGARHLSSATKNDPRAAIFIVELPAGTRATGPGNLNGMPLKKSAGRSVSVAASEKRAAER